MSQFAISNGQDKRFNAFLDTVAIYLTVLEKEQHKKIYIYNTKNMQHFLQPRFLGNMLRRILAYRLSKLACGGGSVYQGKIQCILPQQCQQTRQNLKNKRALRQRS